MGYIGNEPTTGHFPVQTNLVGPGPTYILTQTPASAGAIEVSVSGVLQPTTAYSVSGSTLTMAGVGVGIPIFIRYLGETLTLPTIADGVVVESKIGAGAVTDSKIGAGAVTDSKIAGMSASKLTGALPIIDGSALTGVESAIKSASDPTITSFFKDDASARGAKIFAGRRLEKRPSTSRSFNNPFSGFFSWGRLSHLGPPTAPKSTASDSRHDWSADSVMGSLN